MHSLITSFDLGLNMPLSKLPTPSQNQSVAATKGDLAQEILRAVDELKLGAGFGSVEIVLHAGRVTQIEKREKLRFT